MKTGKIPPASLSIEERFIETGKVPCENGKVPSLERFFFPQGTFLFLAAILIFMNFVADILYLFLDPRVSYKTRN